MQENKQEKSQIKQKILQYLQIKGVSPYEFYKSSGVTRGILQQNNGISEDNISRFLAYAPDVSLEWLMQGRGDMLRDIADMQENKQEIYRSDEKKGIPLIPIDAMAGFFQGEQTVMLAECERYIVPSFKNADFLITVRGDSMTPRYYSGDLIACKSLSLADIFFQWGKVYVIDTEQGALVKKVEQGSGADTITLVSENTAYKPFEIPRTSIYHIAVVLGIIRAE